VGRGCSGHEVVDNGSAPVSDEQAGSAIVAARVDRMLGVVLMRCSKKRSR
jgi:hypothetical protein